MIDVLYCEQLMASSQFFNMVSNIFFIISSIFLYLFFKSKKIKDFKSKLFLFLIPLIGIGSFLWHFKPNNLTFFLDVIPILLILVLFIYFLLINLTNNSKLSKFLLGIYVTLLIIIFFISSKNNYLNGAEGYVFTLIFLGILMGYGLFHKKKKSLKLQLIFYLFLVGLIFRQIDLFYCSSLSIGTHFVWHLFTAITLYFSIKWLYE